MSNFIVTLELTEGFRLDTDLLDVGQLGYLSETIDAPIYSVNVKRGKNRELDKFSPGSCEIVFDNRDRLFDPTNVDSAIYGSIYPGRRIQVQYIDPEDTYFPIFTGFTADWSFAYGLGGEATATVSCVDGLSQLAGATIESISAPAELSGARMARVLTSADVDYSVADLFIEPGNTVVAAQTITGSAIDHLQEVALTEQGLFFITGNGWLTFMERNTNNQVYAWDAYNYGSAKYNYTDIQFEYSNDTLVNFARAVAPVGTAISRNVSSIEIYQAQSQDYQTLHNDVNELDNFVSYLTNEFGEPEFRISELTFNINNYEDATSYDPWSAGVLAESEIGRLVNVGFAPPGGGDPIVQEPSQIIGVQHKATPSRYDITVTLMKAIGVNSFRLDSISYGVLNVNKLAF